MYCICECYLKCKTKRNEQPASNKRLLLSTSFYLLSQLIPKACWNNQAVPANRLCVHQKYIFDPHFMLSFVTRMPYILTERCSYLCSASKSYSSLNQLRKPFSICMEKKRSLSTWQRCIINDQSLLKWKMHLIFMECKILSGNSAS